MRINYKPPAVKEEKEEKLIPIRPTPIDVGRDSRQEEMEAVAVRVRSEFHLK